MKLFLCEKPSQAKDIARVVGAHQRRDNFQEMVFRSHGQEVICWNRLNRKLMVRSLPRPGDKVPYPLFLNSGKWWLKKMQFRCFGP